MKTIHQLYKLVTEAFNNFKYKIPSDKSHLLFDFYILISLPIWDIEHKKDGAETKFIVKEAQNTLVNYLKSQFLEELVFCICAEFRHLFDENKSKDVLDFAKKHDMEDFIKKYYKYYNAAKDGGELYLVDKRIHSDIKGQNYSYTDAYRAYLYTKVPPAEFIKFAKGAFLELKWRTSYGGKPWASICDGWILLKDANDYNSKVIAIDHVFDLQHNTDTVFNKIKAYADDDSEFSWIKKALDKKRNAESLYEMWDDMSPQLKHFAAFVIKLGSGTDYELYLKKIKGELFPASAADNKDTYLGARNRREFMDELVKVARGKPSKLDKEKDKSYSPITVNKLTNTLSTTQINMLKFRITMLSEIIEDSSSKKQEFSELLLNTATELKISVYEILSYADYLLQNFLDTATLHNRTDIIDFLVDNEGLLYGKANISLFLTAVNSGCTHMIDILLKNGFNINYDDCIALRVAIQLESMPMIKYLVSKGIKVNIPLLDNGKSPINHAAEMGNLEIVKYLYDNGAIIHEEDLAAASTLSIGTYLTNKWNRTKRRKEKTSKDTKITDENVSDHLLKCIIDDNINEFGDTLPLFSSGISDDNVTKLFDNIVKFNREEMLKLSLIAFKKRIVTYLPAFFEACRRKNNLELVKAFINYGLITHAYQTEGLRLAGIYDNIDAVKYLVEKGDIEPKLNDYSALISISRLNGIDEITKYLITTLNIPISTNKQLAKDLLYYAMSYSDLSHIKFLIEDRRADVSLIKVSDIPDNEKLIEYLKPHLIKNKRKFSKEDQAWIDAL